MVTRKLRIAIDCRIANAQMGVGTAVLALARALSDSATVGQEYTFVVREDMLDWLAPYVYGPCKLVGIPAPFWSSIKATLRKVGPLRTIWNKTRGMIEGVPTSDGYVESQQFDLVHFPTQAAYLTGLPSIYQPWDLQHLHYPQFFGDAELLRRQKCYPTFCDRASYVCVQTEWTKADVVSQFQVSESKVVVIPWGSVFDAYKAPSAEEIRATIEKHSLPRQFFFYPAATWPHKNHEVILRALSILKSERGSAPPVYFTGSSLAHRAFLDKLAIDLGIVEQVHFLGFLAPEELQAIFRLSTAMVFASKFEGFGLPILEAFQAQVPVISSSASTLPEVAGDAALYFDPDSPTELAVLLRAVLDTPQMRDGLIERGRVVLSRRTINDTAADFQALYEKTAALQSQEDHRASTSAAL